VTCPDLDSEYFSDAMESSSDAGRTAVIRFAAWQKTFRAAGPVAWDRGGVSVSERMLGVRVARALGGSANTRVNNASVVSRIDYLGRSILICGDMEATGWAHALADPGWRDHVSNIDILVAPHHGHSSSYSQDLMNLAKPSLVLFSALSGDDSTDSRYSSDGIAGMVVGSKVRSSLSTRADGHIAVTITEVGRLAGEVSIVTSRTMSNGEREVPRYLADVITSILSRDHKR